MSDMLNLSAVVSAENTISKNAGHLLTGHAAELGNAHAHARRKRKERVVSVT